METADEIALEKKGTVFYGWNQPLILQIEIGPDLLYLHCMYFTIITEHARKIIKYIQYVINFLKESKNVSDPLLNMMYNYHTLSL